MDPLLTNRGFYISDPTVTPSYVKFKRAQKYSANVLVWIAVSDKDISQLFVAKQRQAINEITYLKECVKSRLMPFIKDITITILTRFCFGLIWHQVIMLAALPSFLKSKRSVLYFEKKFSELSSSTSCRNDSANFGGKS